MTEKIIRVGNVQIGAGMGEGGTFRWMSNRSRTNCCRHPCASASSLPAPCRGSMIVVSVFNVVILLVVVGQ